MSNTSQIQPPPLFIFLASQIDHFLFRMGKLLKALAKHQRHASAAKPRHINKCAQEKVKSVPSTQDTLVHIWKNRGVPFHASLIPYAPNSRILLLGEGDFSFAACLQVTYPELDFIATGLDSPKSVSEKYDRFAEHPRHLPKYHPTLVDATRLHTDKKLQAAFRQNVGRQHAPHQNSL